MAAKKCETCQLQREIIADLRTRLDAADVERRALSDRLLALTAPQALMIARGEAPRPRSAPPSFGSDPTTGHDITLGGEDLPVVRDAHGNLVVNVGGTNVPVDEFQRMMQLLGDEQAGLGPLQRMGLVDGEHPANGHGANGDDEGFSG